MIVEANKRFGLPTENLYSDTILQQEQDTCAIKAQEILLNTAGIPVTESQLVQEAIQHGWYTPGQGTSPCDVGKLMEAHGMDVQQQVHGNIYNLVSELSRCHFPLVGVDSGELLNPGPGETFEDAMIGPRADHALLVSGIDFNDDYTGGVVNVIDPGTGDWCKGYDMDQFNDAWADSDNFMISII